MADKILKQNKIPGCERLTRPEEIEALSKYLRNIKEVLSENTDLDQTNLEIPGKTTGQFRNITELPEDYEKLDKVNEVESLYDSVLGLDDARENSLEDHIENLNVREDIELSDYKDTIEDRRNLELSNYKDTIEDNDKYELVLKKEKDKK